MNMDMQSKIKIKDSVIVFKARTARQLLKEGFHLIDIKPLKEDTRLVYSFLSEQMKLWSV